MVTLSRFTSLRCVVYAALKKLQENWLTVTFSFFITAVTIQFLFSAG